MKALAQDYGVHSISSEHTGLFVSPTEKLGSIGVQVRHRLTTHGFALNVTREPIPWFDQVVACGLTDVRATSLNSVTGRDLRLSEDIMFRLVEHFHSHFESAVEPLPESEVEVGGELKRLQMLSHSLGKWKVDPND
jgi:lipoyl(octanoyl) transferase